MDAFDYVRMTYLLLTRANATPANTGQAVTSTSQPNAPPVREQDALTKNTQTSSAEDPVQPATSSEGSPALGDTSTREESLNAPHENMDTTENATPASDRPFVEEMARRLDDMVDSDEEPRWPILVQRYTSLEKKFGFPRKLVSDVTNMDVIIVLTILNSIPTSSSLKKAALPR